MSSFSYRIGFVFLLAAAPTFAATEQPPGLPELIKMHLRDKLGYHSLRNTREAQQLGKSIDGFVKNRCAKLGDLLAKPLSYRPGTRAAETTFRKKQRERRAAALNCFGEEYYRFLSSKGKLAKPTVERMLKALRPKWQRWLEKGPAVSALPATPPKSGLERLYDSLVPSAQAQFIPDDDEGFESTGGTVTVCGQVFDKQLELMETLPLCENGTYEEGVRIKYQFKRDGNEATPNNCFVYVKRMELEAKTATIADCRGSQPSPSPTESPSPDESPSPSPEPSESGSPDPNESSSPYPTESPTTGAGECHGQAYTPTHYIYTYSVKFGTRPVHCGLAFNGTIQRADPAASCTSDGTIVTEVPIVQNYDDVLCQVAPAP